MRNLIYLSILLLFVSPATAKNNCEVRDISGVQKKEDIQVLKLLGNEWMRNAYVCQMGEFEIATPTGSSPEHRNTIFLFKKGKPVFYRQNDGTYIYSPKLEDAAFEKILVNIWHGNERQDIERIWYDTVGKQPRITIDDTNFDGQPDRKVVWRGGEIVEIYKWNEDRWQRVESNKESHNNPIKPTQ